MAKTLPPKRHEVEVADDKVGIVHVDIEGQGRQHDAGDAADDKHRHETQGEEHGAGEGGSCRPRWCPAN